MGFFILSFSKVRVWGENFEPEQALDSELMSVFKEFDVCLNIAVPYRSFEEYSNLVREYGEENIDLCLWLLLPSELGYWPSERSVGFFSNYLDEVFDWASEEGLYFPWVGVDLETPIFQIERFREVSFWEKPSAVFRAGLSNLDVGRFENAVVEFSSLLDKIHDFGAKTLTAVNPLVINDTSTGDAFIQDLLEVPVFGIDWDRVSFMIYTSMLSGYSKNLISSEESTTLLYNYLSEAVEKLQDRAAVSIGVTGTGALGDEPYYENPSELKPDVEASLAAGVKDISIFCIEGILKRGNPREWFDMVQNSKPRKPDSSLKVSLIRSGAKIGTSLGSKIFR